MIALREIQTRVAGVTFAPGYPRNLADLARRCLLGPVPLELVRDIDNGHDLNAISVRLEGRHLGHVPAAVNEDIARAMDRGVPWRAEALYVAVDQDHRDRPGLEVRMYEEEPF